MRYASMILVLVLVAWTTPAGDDKTPPAVKELLERLKSNDGKAAIALVAHGKAAVPGLIEVLQGTDTFQASHAAHALGRIGPAAKDAAPALAKALSNQERGVSHSAALALGKIGPAAVPALLTALKDASPQVRSLAAAALKDIGPAARDKAAAPLLAALKQSLTAEDPLLRIPLIEAVGEMGEASKDAVPVLV